MAAWLLQPESHIGNIGAAGGVGGIVAALTRPRARMTLTDVNPGALAFARVNAAAAGARVEAVCGRDLALVDDPINFATAIRPTSSTMPAVPIAMEVI